MLDRIVELNSRLYHHARRSWLSRREIFLIGNFSTLVNDLPLCVKGAWYDLNEKPRKRPNRRTALSRKVFYVYAIEWLKPLKGLVAALSERCSNMERLLETKVQITVKRQKRAWKILMSQLQLLADPSTSRNEQGKDDLNKKRINTFSHGSSKTS